MLLVTIKVKGRLDASWSDCFEGVELTEQGTEVTILCGAVKDQAAFYGLIGKLRDLGLQLIEVSTTEEKNDSIHEVN